jgi:hypothetical protein
MGDQVQSGEFLEDSDRVRRAENGYGTCETNVLGACSCCSQNDNWGGIHELAAMVFADAKNIEANFVG